MEAPYKQIGWPKSWIDARPDVARSYLLSETPTVLGQSCLAKKSQIVPLLLSERSRLLFPLYLSLTVDNCVVNCIRIDAMLATFIDEVLAKVKTEYGAPKCSWRRFRDRFFSVNRKDFPTPYEYILFVGVNVFKGPRLLHYFSIVVQNLNELRQHPENYIAQEIFHKLLTGEQSVM